jgi:NAD(P)-dependent dehydrogenase (short-subunit alcohol dehydrogenase family)
VTVGRLTDRVALVTGAAHGAKAALGASMARALAAEGAAVVLADINDCASVLTEIEAAGGTGCVVHTDVSDEASVATMVAEAVARFGRIDVLVNNAVLASNIPPIPIESMTVEAWDEVMAVNVRGPFLCTRAVLPSMRKRGYGKIINVGSSTMLEGLPNRLHYVASKGAMVAMTRALARELGPYGVRVNTLAPGLVMSDAVASTFEGRANVLEDVRAARSIREDLLVADVLGGVVYLASPESDAVTGQTLVIDNGADMI